MNFDPSALDLTSVTIADRRVGADAIGLSPGLVNLVISGADNPRYGSRGRHAADSWSEDLQEYSTRQGVSVAMLMVAQRMARALDLDDPFVGNDIVFIEAVSYDQPTPRAGKVPSLMPAAYVKTAIRTGLYLPDRSNINTTGDRDAWYAFASGWQRVDLASPTWLAVAEVAYWRHHYERCADGRTPTGQWAVDGDQMLIATAEALCAKKALGHLLDGLPCIALNMPIDDDADYQERRAAALQTEADILQQIRASGGSVTG